MTNYLISSDVQYDTFSGSFLFFLGLGLGFWYLVSVWSRDRLGVGSRYIDTESEVDILTRNSDTPLPDVRLLPRRPRRPRPSGNESWTMRLTSDSRTATQRVLDRMASSSHCQICHPLGSSVHLSMKYLNPQSIYRFPSPSRFETKPTRSPTDTGCYCRLGIVSVSKNIVVTMTNIFSKNDLKLCKLFIDYAICK